MEKELIKQEIEEIFEKMSSPEYVKRIQEITDMLYDEIQLDDIDEVDQINGKLPERKTEITGFFVR